jgi:hypothetical protein
MSSGHGRALMKPERRSGNSPRRPMATRMAVGRPIEQGPRTARPQRRRREDSVQATTLAPGTSGAQGCFKGQLNAPHAATPGHAALPDRYRDGLLAPAGMRGPEGITGPAALAKFSWLTRPAMWAATWRNTPPTVLSGAAAIKG